MADTITRARIEDALARANAATDGPWGHYLPRGGGSDPVFGAIPGDEVATVNRPNDWRFIAASRSDVPAMAEALLRVLDLHEPEEIFTGGREVLVCSKCYYHAQFGLPGAYPCPTVRAITGEQQGGGDRG